MVANVLVRALDQPSLGAVEGMLESEGHTTAITMGRQMTWLMTISYGQLVPELG